MPTTQPMIMGDHVFDKSGAFKGMIGGNATISEGIDLVLGGMVGGDLIIQSNATVHLSAMVSGRVINNGGSVISDTE